LAKEKYIPMILRVIQSVKTTYHEIKVEIFLFSPFSCSHKKKKNEKKKKLYLLYGKLRGVNPVPVPGYWPKPGTGTGVPVIGFSITGPGSG
jgi:hypothetical protein